MRPRGYTFVDDQLFRKTDRRAFVGALARGLLASSFDLEAKPAKRSYRIGWLHLGGAWDLAPFRRGLNELGWIEGHNLVIEPRWADNHPDRLPALAAELVERKVDVIVTQTTPAALAAKQATAQIPIVMSGSGNPVQVGLVKSLAHPGANVTGLTANPGPGFYTKMVQLLKEAAPAISRLAVLERPGDGYSREIGDAASALGLTVVNTEAASEAQVPIALAAAMRARADGLFVSPIPVNDAQRAVIVNFTLANRLPSIGGDLYFVSMGGLMSYWTSWQEVRRQTATYVDKILRGLKPADLPIEQPTKFELVINLKTVKAFGLTIPRAMMLWADEVIK